MERFLCKIEFHKYHNKIIQTLEVKGLVNSNSMSPFIREKSTCAFCNKEKTSPLDFAFDKDIQNSIHWKP